MQIIALPFLQLPYGTVERRPQRKEREMEKKKKKEEGKEEIKLPADEIDLFSPLGSRGMEAF